VDSALVRALLEGFLDGPLTAWLVGVEAALTVRRDPPAVVARRGLALYAALLGARALLLSGLLERPHRFAPAAMLAAFALFRLLERALALPEKEAACVAATLPAFLFLQPAPAAMPLAEFSAWLAGVVAAFTLLSGLAGGLGALLDRRPAFGRFGGVPLLLVATSGLLVVANAFRGLIR